MDTTGDLCHVTVKDINKGKITEIDCEVVLSAVGVITNLEGLGLEEYGVEVERTKVVVDDFYRTNCEGIYAIGDIVHGPALAKYPKLTQFELNGLEVFSAEEEYKNENEKAINQTIRMFGEGNVKVE